MSFFDSIFLCLLFLSPLITRIILLSFLIDEAANPYPPNEVWPVFKPSVYSSEKRSGFRLTCLILFLNQTEYHYLEISL